MWSLQRCLEWDDYEIIIQWISRLKYRPSWIALGTFFHADVIPIYIRVVKVLDGIQLKVELQESRCATWRLYSNGTTFFWNEGHFILKCAWIRNWYLLERHWKNWKGIVQKVYMVWTINLLENGINKGCVLPFNIKNKWSNINMEWIKYCHSKITVRSGSSLLTGSSAT